MKKGTLIIGAILLIGIILLFQGTCGCSALSSVLPGVFPNQSTTPAAKTTPKPPTTPATLIERIQTLESQISSLNSQLTVLQSQNASLKARVDALEKEVKK